MTPEQSQQRRLLAAASRDLRSALDTLRKVEYNDDASDLPGYVMRISDMIEQIENTRRAIGRS